MIAVALDGPSGAGKSTLARCAAKELGFMYVDTGACYRAVAYYALSRGINLRDAQTLVPALEDLHLSLVHSQQGEQRIFLDDQDVSEEIRTPIVAEGASLVSVIPEVRSWLLETQRSLARTHNVIMDGRDIGTVVLPDAQVKIFLTADPKVRAQRRYEEYLAKGTKIEYSNVLDDLRQRDLRDIEREAAPLRQAEDAVLLDTSDLSFQQALSAVVQIVKERGTSL